MLRAIGDDWQRQAVHPVLVGAARSAAALKENSRFASEVSVPEIYLRGGEVGIGLEKGFAAIGMTGAIGTAGQVALARIGSQMIGAG
jgi:hypothetical protein